jgi:hypothetical protein
MSGVLLSIAVVGALTSYVAASASYLFEGCLRWHQRHPKPKMIRYKAVNTIFPTSVCHAAMNPSTNMGIGSTHMNINQSPTTLAPRPCCCTDLRVSNRESTPGHRRVG